MKIYLGQINTTVGDFEGNLSLILDGLRDAEAQGADIALFPELCITGYPPMDLLNYRSFIEKSREYLDKLTKYVSRTAVIVGFVEDPEDVDIKGWYNSAALIHEGEIKFIQRKMLLPTYDVFDEARYFIPGSGSKVFEFGGKRIAITVCEDIWNDRDFWDEQRYRIDPVEEMAKEGFDILLNISASPFNLDKISLRSSILKSLCKKYGVPGVIVNSVGGNDELIFDGTSMACDKNGEIRHACISFDNDSSVIDLDNLPAPVKGERFSLSHAEQTFKALTLGVHDYFAKCGFTKATLGLSGGIDSAVTLCIGAAALGKENVLPLIMPSRYSSDGSVFDSEQLIKNLEVDSRMITIDPIFKKYLETFKDEFKGLEMDITEENFQARIRGNILMGFSNKYGHLVLTTGNKSEIAVGYCTLYGDMAGGLAVLSDVPKTLVYEVAEYINRDGEIIPRNIITKPPSAELKHDQTDQDSLPPYDVLDAIIHRYVEEEKDLPDIVADGFEEQLVRRIMNMIDRNEYKRKQMATGLKITRRAFGFGRRMPIAHKFYR
jgi:NAD+ synthase (glutamine-hydrolysing)